MSRRLPALWSLPCCAIIFAACSKPDTEAADTTTAAAPAAVPASPAPLSLSQVAGRWNVRNIPETGDTTPTPFVLNATADTTGWTFTFPGRQPIPMRVAAVAGDSIVTVAGPFESARRKGVRVRTRAVMRLEGDRLVGITVARYVTTGPDSVLRLRMEATRAP
ncbi:MAG: hypothetical protein WKG32_23335 [Gemmatimonadaceae bacterium]